MKALPDAVVAGVIAELDDVMCSAAGEADDPLAALCAEASAYVRFAVERPTHYRYATMEERRAGTRGNEREDLLTESAQGRLGTAVAACMESGLFSRADPHTATCAIWSAAHGIAALMIAKPDLGWATARRSPTVQCEQSYGATLRGRHDGLS